APVVGFLRPPLAASRVWRISSALSCARCFMDSRRWVSGCAVCWMSVALMFSLALDESHAFTATRLQSVCPARLTCSDVERSALRPLLVAFGVAGYTERLELLVGSGRGARTEEERERVATEVIRVCSIGAAAVVVQPLPMLDIALLTPIHVAMVKAIGGIYGYTLDRKTALGIIG